MRAPLGSLLETDQPAGRAAPDRLCAAAWACPWGVSESAYNARDIEFTYQYSNFGVPGLGLKRGLGENVVIAPYATALAAMVDPARGGGQLHALAAGGARGRYGFYEALDFTPSRLPEGEAGRRSRAYMAHHQGMTHRGPRQRAARTGVMRARFHARADDPGDRAAAAGAHRRATSPSPIRGPRRCRRRRTGRTIVGRRRSCAACTIRTPPARRRICCRTDAIR